jgi:hypothetical protein
MDHKQIRDYNHKHRSFLEQSDIIQSICRNIKESYRNSKAIQKYLLQTGLHNHHVLLMMNGSLFLSEIILFAAKGEQVCLRILESLFDAIGLVRRVCLWSSDIDGRIMDKLKAISKKLIDLAFIDCNIGHNLGAYLGGLRLYKL